MIAQDPFCFNIDHVWLHLGLFGSIAVQLGSWWLIFVSLLRRRAVGSCDITPRTKMTNIVPTKKIEKSKVESKHGCLGKTPNGTRLPDHYL